jgi:hypothetical protein
MMKKTLLAITIFLLSVSVGYGQADKTPLVLTITSDKPVVAVGEEITLFFKLQNVSGKMVSFFHSKHPETFAIKVKKPDGTDCPHSSLQVMNPGAEELSLSPNQSIEYSAKGKIYQGEMYLSKGTKLSHEKTFGIFVDFSENVPFLFAEGPGSYLIEGQYQDAMMNVWLGTDGSEAAKKSFNRFAEENKDKWRGTITSNPITFEMRKTKGISKEEALLLVQKYIKENNISVIDIKKPLSIKEFSRLKSNDSWLIHYEYRREYLADRKYLADPPPYHVFIVDKITGEIRKIGLL